MNNKNSFTEYNDNHNITVSTPINIPAVKKRTGSVPELNHNNYHKQVHKDYIKLYKSLKNYKLENPKKSHNIATFFRGLDSDSYTLNIKKEKFQPTSVDDYNYKIVFNLNKNWLSLYTDFILLDALTTDKILVECNGKHIYKESPVYMGENYGFLLSRPNLLPLISLPILKFELIIYIKSKNPNPKLLYTEIKPSPDIQAIFCLIKDWHIVVNSNTIFFGDEYETVNNIWDVLKSIEHPLEFKSI